MANNDIIGMHVTRVNRSRLESIVKHLVTRATYVADNVVNIHDSDFNQYKNQIPLFFTRNGPVSFYPLQYYGIREMRVSLVHLEQNDGTFHCCMQVQGANVPEFEINSPVLQSITTNIPLLEYRSRQITSSFSTAKFEAFLAIGGNFYYYQRIDQNRFYGCKPAIFDRLFQSLDEKGEALVLCTFTDQTGALQACTGVNCNQLPLNPLSQETRRDMILQRRPVLGSSFNNNNGRRSREGSNFHPDSNLLPNRNNYTYVGRGGMRRGSSAIAEHEANRVERDARIQMGLPDIHNADVDQEGNDDEEASVDDNNENNDGSHHDGSHHDGGGNDPHHGRGPGPGPGRGGGAAGGGGNGRGHDHRPNGNDQGGRHGQGGGGGSQHGSNQNQSRQNRANNTRQNNNEAGNRTPGGHSQNNILPINSPNTGQSQSSNHTQGSERYGEHDPLLEAVLSGVVRDAGEMNSHMSQMSQNLGGGNLNQTRMISDGEPLNPMMSTANQNPQEIDQHFMDLSPISSRNSLASGDDMARCESRPGSAPADPSSGRFNETQIQQGHQPPDVRQPAGGGGAGQPRRQDLHQVQRQNHVGSRSAEAAELSSNERHRGTGARGSGNRGAGARAGAGAGGFRSSGAGDIFRGRERFGGKSADLPLSRGNNSIHGGYRHPGGNPRGAYSNRASRQAPPAAWGASARRSWPNLARDAATSNNRVHQRHQEERLCHNLYTGEYEGHGAFENYAADETGYYEPSERPGGSYVRSYGQGGGSHEQAVHGLHQADQQARGEMEPRRRQDLPEGYGRVDQGSNGSAQIHGGPSIQGSSHRPPSSQSRNEVSRGGVQGSQESGSQTEGHPDASPRQSLQAQGPRLEAGGETSYNRGLEHDNREGSVDGGRDLSVSVDEREFQTSENQRRVGVANGNIRDSSHRGGRDHGLRGVQRGGRGERGDGHGELDPVSKPFSANSDTWPPPENKTNNPFDKQQHSTSLQQQNDPKHDTVTTDHEFKNLTPANSVIIGEKRKNPSTDTDENDPLYRPDGPGNMDSNDAEDEMTMADEVDKEYDPGPIGDEVPCYTPSSSSSSRPVSSVLSSTSEERDMHCLVEFLGSSDSEKHDLHKELDNDIIQRSAVKAISSEMKFCHEQFKEWQLLISQEKVSGHEGLRGLDKLVRGLLMLQSKIDHGGYNFAVCTTAAVLKRINLVKMEISAAKKVIIDEENIKMAQQREDEMREQSRKFQEQQHREQMRINAKVQEEILEAQRRRAQIEGAAAAAVAGPAPQGLEEDIVALAEGNQSGQQHQQQQQHEASDSWSHTESARLAAAELAANPALGQPTGGTPKFTYWADTETPLNPFRGRESENVGESLLSAPSPPCHDTENFSLLHADHTILPTHLLLGINLPMPDRPSLGHELEVAAASSSGPLHNSYPKGDEASLNLLSRSTLDSPTSKPQLPEEKTVSSMVVSSPPTITTTAPGATISTPIPSPPAAAESVAVTTMVTTPEVAAAVITSR